MTRRHVGVVVIALLALMLCLYLFLGQGEPSSDALVCARCGKALTEESAHRIKLDNWILTLCDRCYEQVTEEPGENK